MSTFKPKTIGLSLAISMLWCAPGQAASVCIAGGNSSALSQWLETYEANAQDDEIRLASGTFDAPSGGFAFDSTEAHRLMISGGWNTGCTSIRYQDATVINGAASRPLMRIVNANGAVEVRRITWANGYKLNVSAGAAGLQVNGVAGAGTDVIIELNQFVANENAAEGSIGGGAGLFASTVNGHLLVRNNLFVGNAGGTGSAAHLLVSGSGIGYVVSNTVAGNGRLGDNVGGLYLLATGSTPADAFIASNNVLWDNVGNDLRIPTHTLLYNNDISDQLGISNPGSTNNYNVDPQFELGSYRLRQGSPLIDAGFTNAFGGLSAVDLDGYTRVRNDVVDIGAYEDFSGIFADGFE